MNSLVDFEAGDNERTAESKSGRAAASGHPRRRAGAPRRECRTGLRADRQGLLPSLITQAMVFERYGFRLGVDQLADVLGISKGAVYNQISAGTLPVRTYVDAGRRWADYRDVALHLDACRSLAA